MSLINKEKFLNGVGKAVDVTNKAADKVETFVKDNELDIKAKNVAKKAEKGIKKVGNKVGEVAGEVVSGYKSKTAGASASGTSGASEKTCNNEACSKENDN